MRLALLLLAGGLFACSGTSADQACTDSAHAQCIQLQTCEPTTLQAAYGTEAACETRIKSACLDSLSAPSTGATPAKTEACAQAYAQWSCTDYFDKNNIPTACAQATGAISSGGACEYGGQCQTGFCAIIPGNSCGTCAGVPKAGDPCSQLTTCGSSLACTTDTQTCVAYVTTTGGACGAGEPCGAGLSCVAPGGIGTPGTCQSSGTQVGATCDSSLKTGPSCEGVLGLYCDGITKQCGTTTYVGSGACGYTPDAGTLVACANGACETGQCALRAADNAACVLPDGGASDTSFGCMPPARCVSGTCQAVTASGCH